MCVLSHAWLSATLCTVTHQAPLCMELSRQEYWRGLPFPPPGDLPDPGIEPKPLCLLHWQTGSLPRATWEAHGGGDCGAIGTVEFSHTHRTACKTESWWEAAAWHRELSLVLCDDLYRWECGGEGGGKEAQEGWDIFMQIVDSHCCTAETNTTL